MSDSTPVLWRAAPESELLWAQWDDEYVLYHRLSGKTHFLNLLTVLLLQDVLRQPRDLEAASAALAEAQSALVNDDFRHEIAETLLRLEDLGLVARQ